MWQLRTSTQTLISLDVNLLNLNINLCKNIIWLYNIITNNSRIFFVKNTQQNNIFEKITYIYNIIKKLPIKERLKTKTQLKNSLIGTIWLTNPNYEHMCIIKFLNIL